MKIMHNIHIYSGGKYIYSSTVLKYNFEVLIYFILVLHYNSDGDIVLFTTLHLFDTFSQ